MHHTNPRGSTAAPKLLTIPQVAAMLQIGRDATYALCHNAQLRHVKHGKRYLIPEFALDEYISANLSAPTSVCTPPAIRGKGGCPKSIRSQRGCKGSAAVGQHIQRAGGEQ